MARPEEIAPWAATEAASREPYPRKNLYFIGAGQDVVYDYLIWRANVRGYQTLEGLPARSSSEMINDLLRRAFLRDMLDQDEADNFDAWRSSEYERAGIGSDTARRGEPASYIARVKQIESSGVDPRLEAFLRKRFIFSVDKATRVEVWEAQGGRCADCGAETRLELHRAKGAPMSSEDVRPRADGRLDSSNYVALCAPCFKEREASPVVEPPSTRTTTRSRAGLKHLLNRN
jgi:hypothetical protein